MRSFKDRGKNQIMLLVFTVVFNKLNKKCMFKKILIILLFVTLFFPLQHIFAQEPNNNANIYFFWGVGCPHCAKEKPFLEKMRQKYPQLKIKEFEVWNSADNR
ncbi:MAG: hypothetical protein A2Y67_00245 [Candidatus Buchananbacteria bacterium RBG_13_39_9]|uniref:Thioredoxin domain-containing protein n=1 Tax=Candidatus Buchananbacteria bacterium RBG_13_39_9 TaxID=1797531 RepID=A0A1G1XR91_9BACT|nr:MAG: hypothetical protein A2Y67_00245 [Candidatus Buchananbacteria bacterium RBG_13_39_9]